MAGAPAIEIRRLRAADVEDYRRIRLSALATAPLAFGSVLSQEAGRPLDDHRERLRASHVLGAWCGARIVGMVGLRPETGPKDAHKGFLWGFFVEPDFRGRGAGTALLAAILAEARGRVEQVTLAVVEESAAAIALYERARFVRYGLEPRALKDGERYFDEILMIAVLRA